LVSCGSVNCSGIRSLTRHWYESTGTNRAGSGSGRWNFEVEELPRYRSASTPPPRSRSTRPGGLAVGRHHERDAVHVEVLLDPVQRAERELGAAAVELVHHEHQRALAARVELARLEQQRADLGQRGAELAQRGALLLLHHEDAARDAGVARGGLVARAIAARLRATVFSSLRQARRRDPELLRGLLEPRAEVQAELALAFDGDALEQRPGQRQPRIAQVLAAPRIERRDRRLFSVPAPAATRFMKMLLPEPQLPLSEIVGEPGRALHQPHQRVARGLALQVVVAPRVGGVDTGFVELGAAPCAGS
jgi:hypothetical protein